MFKLDSPLINFLNKVADIMILNLLFLFFSIPVFTAGASFSAAYYVGFKMVKNEESYLMKTFWRSFKENFRQATAMWLIVLAIAGILTADYRIMRYSGLEFANWMKISTVSVTVIVLMGISYIFPLQAYFTNSVKNTMKNAFLIALSHLPASFFVLVVYIVPVAVYIFVPQTLPALFLLSFGTVIYAKAFVLSKVFRKYGKVFEDAEKEQEEGEGDGLPGEEEDAPVSAARVFRDGKFVEVTENSPDMEE